MSEKFKFYKKDETVVHNVRRWGNWFTNGMLGLGSILTAIPVTAPLGVTILGGAALDKSSDLSIGNSVEQKYNEIKGKNNTVSQDSGKVFNFGTSGRSGSVKIAA